MEESETGEERERDANADDNPDDAEEELSEMVAEGNAETIVEVHPGEGMNDEEADEAEESLKGSVDEPPPCKGVDAALRQSEWGRGRDGRSSGLERLSTLGAEGGIFVEGLAAVLTEHGFLRRVVGSLLHDTPEHVCRCNGFPGV